jgi:replicative DNA helicase
MGKNNSKEKTWSVNTVLSMETRTKLDVLAARSGMNISSFIRRILNEAAQKDTVYRLVETHDGKSKAGDR